MKGDSTGVRRPPGKAGYCPFQVSQLSPIRTVTIGYPNFRPPRTRSLNGNLTTIWRKTRTGNPVVQVQNLLWWQSRTSAVGSVGQFHAPNAGTRNRPRVYEA